MSATVLIADDHPMMRDGLSSLLESAQYEVVARCADGAEAKTGLARHQPALALLDISMPAISGLDLLNWAQGQALPTRLVLITAGLDVAQLAQGLHQGAHGLLLKDAAGETILSCVQAVLDGKRWIDNSVMAMVLEHMNQYPTGSEAKLTKREQEIARLVAAGLRNKEIGEDLGITEGTVKMHLYNIYQKLGIESRMELARFKTYS